LQQLWFIVLFIKSLRKDSTAVATLKEGRVVYSDSGKKAEILNRQFSSVFTIEDSPPPQDIFNQDFYPDMLLITVHTTDVAKLLRDLKPHKATGPDQVPAGILKEIADEIASAITLLFQASLQQGAVPSDWSEALVTPLFKKRARNQASNYCPVSLTLIACKCLEHIVYSQIMDQIEAYHILHEAHHGFCKGHSCESQLILITHDLAKGLDE